MVLKSLDRDLNYNLELAIRPAAIEDTKAASAILARSFYDFPEYIRWVYPFLRFTINEDLRYRLRSASPHYCCLVAKARTSIEGDKVEEVVVGTIEIALRSTLWSNNSQHPYISNLAVDLEYRCMGIGSKLLQACERVALDWGYQETKLHVLDCNESAKRLYYCHGYQISQIEPNWGSLWFDCSSRLLLRKTFQRS